MCLSERLRETRVAPVPQSAAEPQDAGGTHFAPVQRPSGHWASLEQVDVLHLAPLQRLLFVQSVSTLHPSVAHLAPLHRALDGQSVSTLHATGVLHLALLQSPPTVQVASVEQL